MFIEYDCFLFFEAVKLIFVFFLWVVVSVELCGCFNFVSGFLRKLAVERSWQSDYVFFSFY